MFLSLLSFFFNVLSSLFHHLLWSGHVLSKGMVVLVVSWIALVIESSASLTWFGLQYCCERCVLFSFVRNFALYSVQLVHL